MIDSTLARYGSATFILLAILEVYVAKHFCTGHGIEHTHIIGQFRVDKKGIYDTFQGRRVDDIHQPAVALR